MYSSVVANDSDPSREVPMRYAIVIEKAASNYSAYVPDLPGGVATGVSLEVAQPMP